MSFCNSYPRNACACYDVQLSGYSRQSWLVLSWNYPFSAVSCKLVHVTTSLIFPAHWHKVAMNIILSPFFILRSLGLKYSGTPDLWYRKVPQWNKSFCCKGIQKVWRYEVIVILVNSYLHSFLPTYKYFTLLTSRRMVLYRCHINGSVLTLLL